MSPGSLGQVPPTVAFRCEAGARAGYGHLSRCLALAGALGSRASCRFDVSRCDAAARALVAGVGFAAWEGGEPDAVVFDGYGFGDAEISSARGLAATPPVIAVIDDFGGRRIDCDLVVSPGPQRGPRDWNLPRGCRVLLGPRHALLGPAFLHAPRAPVAGVSRLLLGFGGTDATDATAWLLPLLPPGLAVDVLLGPGYRGAAVARAGLQMHLALPPEGVARLMGLADAAITAPGVMALELVAVGRPALLFALAPEHEQVGLALDRAGLARYGGAAGAAGASAAITEFLADHAGRAAMSRAAAAIDAAGGAARVAGALVEALAERAAKAQEGGP